MSGGDDELEASGDGLPDPGGQDAGNVAPPGGRHAPATLDNRDDILNVLRRVLPATGLVLEVASGTGEHAAYFSPWLPGRTWQPTDSDPRALTSISAWAAQAGGGDIRQPLLLDACAARWPVTRADAVVCVNMIHIAPWSACEGLLAGAARVLPRGGPLVVYGPFMEGGQHTATSNEDFDRALRERDPAWGVRDLSEVVKVARRCGLEPDERVALAWDNLAVVFRKR